MCDGAGTAGVRVAYAWTCVVSVVVTHAVDARDLLLVLILFAVCTRVVLAFTLFPY